MVELHEILPPDAAEKKTRQHPPHLHKHTNCRNDHSLPHDYMDSGIVGSIRILYSQTLELK